MKYKFLIALLLISGYLKAQNLKIIPQPRSVVSGSGQISINNHSTISLSDTSLTTLAIYFQKELFKVKGLSPAINNGDLKSTVKLVLTNTNQTIGAYALKITPGQITISSSNKEGVFYGLISLLQLIKDHPKEGDNLTLASTDATDAREYQNVVLASTEITDAPRYQWRGLMLDESRHFFGKQKVKQILDWMAYYKLNKFHWHLTDVQGWRIEIKKYPRLTSVGGVGDYSDTSAEALPMYYTQNDIKEVVNYAAQRFITVIPEIDMPGHATAANKAYPEYSGGSVAGYPNFTFNPAKEETYQYLANVIKETTALFPSKMIHLGGDEVVLGIKAWSLDTAIARMMQNKGFADVGTLERYFFKRMTDTVTNMGSKILAWDEATQTDLPAGETIIFWWRQNLPGQLSLALQKNYQVVLCPRLPLYLDFLQDGTHVSGRNWKGVFNRYTDIYNFPDRQLNADQLASNQIIGVQANIWTEKIASEKRLDFMLFPRIAGLAEAGWTAPEVKNEAAFNERVQAGLKNWDAADIYYFNPFDPQAHPEAVDFAPVIRKTPVAEKHGRHHKAHSKASKRGNRISAKSHKSTSKSKSTKNKPHKKRK
ncbi:beta-N-acetylhexosaminidase [Mucilaginibacter sp. KACC 22773]|uniref:beta-N-acetylhexosaminidase n=1 Tax=Mucilaginibacter sp. KACC 22773 TaxID=3025671 RepID=UPI00236710D2|nr:beta-N-acetylhexosaminidase [Mucilaginibacter sp. KACC 22773]WDF80549.1 beta-N-acetylhexosaminidase [Mucilaginibacter sp. KACC 22773]